MKQSVLWALLLLQVLAHSHHYDCVFEHTNQDLRQISAKSTPDIPIHPPGTTLNGRLLTTPNAVRAPIRITLDTTAFNTLTSGLNGANITTTTKLNFVLRTMMVTKTFYQKRLQVGQVGTITAPDPCVDFSPTATAQTGGYSNTDLVIFVQYITDKNQGYGATGKSCKYFAGTTPDYTLQTGRPTVGRIIFNTYQLVDQQSSLTNRLFQSVTSTALHQTMHILGFDSTLYPSYLDPTTGNPYAATPLLTLTLNPSRPASKLLTTPYVLAWAQNFFGCANLTGMPMENEDGTAGGGGSHWQRVAMYDELMTGTSLGTAKYFSGLTFALLKDTGWYSVDDSFAQTSNYGYQKGCSFLIDACYSSTPFTEFCNSNTQGNISACSSSFVGKAFCTSQSGFMTDSCGIYGEYFSCIDPDSVDSGNYKPYSLQTWGSGSFCAASTMGISVLSSNLQSRCYPYVCNSSNNAIVFTIGTFTITCLNNEADVRKTLSGLAGYLTCPSYASFCTMSRKTCSGFCNQNGFCMNAVCNCVQGYYGRTCTQTTCSAGQYYNPVSNNCTVNCPSGYYVNAFSVSCESCQLPCSQCVNTPTTCSSCQTLNGQIQYFYNSVCYSTCPQSTFATASLNCSACNTTTARCLSCSVLAGNCTSCQPNYYLSQPPSQGVTTTCITSCPAGYPFRDEVNFVCLTACQSYQITLGNSSCVLCTIGTFKDAGGNCNTNCTAGFYPQSTQRVCKACDGNCLACDGGYAQNCTSCNNKFLLLKMCWTICPKGFYADTTSNLCAICLSNMSCSACAFNNVTNTSYCTSCKYGYYFTASNNSCGTACLSTQYKNTWNNSCSSCDLSCSTCNGPTSFSCTSCGSTFYLLTNSTGGYCLTACPTLGYIQIGSTSCQSCDSTCSSCNGVGASQCFNCSTGYYLWSGYCRYICPSGTYPNSSSYKCTACDSSCSYCFGGSNASCTSCSTGLYLYNFTCKASCPNGMAPNQWNVCFENRLAWQLCSLLLVLLMAY